MSSAQIKTVLVIMLSVALIAAAPLLSADQIRYQACSSGRDVAYQQCLSRLNDRWFFVGAVEETDAGRKQDADDCRSISNEGFYECTR